MKTKKETTRYLLRIESEFYRTVQLMAEAREASANALMLEALHKMIERQPDFKKHQRRAKAGA